MWSLLKTTETRGASHLIKFMHNGYKFNRVLKIPNFQALTRVSEKCQAWVSGTCL